MAPLSLEEINQLLAYSVDDVTCSICQKKVKHPHNLKMHMRVHDRNKWDFKCRECGKDFSKKCGLKRHLLVHSNSKPLACPLCEKRFRDNSNALRHIRTHPTDGVHSLRPVRVSSLGSAPKPASRTRRRARPPAVTVDVDAPDAPIPQATHSRGVGELNFPVEAPTALVLPRTAATAGSVCGVDVDCPPGSAVPAAAAAKAAASPSCLTDAAQVGVRPRENCHDTSGIATGSRSTLQQPLSLAFPSSEELGIHGSTAALTRSAQSSTSSTPHTGSPHSMDQWQLFLSIAASSGPQAALALIQQQQRSCFPSPLLGSDGWASRPAVPSTLPQQAAQAPQTSHPLLTQRLAQTSSVLQQQGAVDSVWRQPEKGPTAPVVLPSTADPRPGFA